MIGSMAIYIVQNPTICIGEIESRPDPKTVPTGTIYYCEDGSHSIVIGQAGGSNRWVEASSPVGVEFRPESSLPYAHVVTPDIAQETDDDWY